MTATPHRGKEHLFRGLINLLDPTLFPWDPRQSDYSTALRPGALFFLRRMKEELTDAAGHPLFPPRLAHTVAIDLSAAEQAAYTAVMDYVNTCYGGDATLARSVYGKRAASSLVAARATLGRREKALRGPASERADAAAPAEFLTGAADLDLGVADTLDAAGGEEPTKWQVIRVVTPIVRCRTPWSLQQRRRSQAADSVQAHDRMVRKATRLRRAGGTGEQ